MSHTLSYNRYHRQIRLKELGEAGQKKLLSAGVLVIGAGGLGCPALQYLTGAGVGRIGIVDNDKISLDNLHRQTLYSTSDIGKLKAIQAKAVLDALNPEIHITAFPIHLTNGNCIDLFNLYDIIIDGTDNFATRYMINDACVITGKPLIFGAVSRFEGQVSVFNDKGHEGTASVNYRDLFPDPPQEGEVLNCADTGVLGVLPGVVGTLQANEAIKLITGIGTPLAGKILNINLLSNQFVEIGLTARPQTRALIPADRSAFEKVNYEWLCGSSGTVNEINPDEFDAYINSGDALIVDVRENGELPFISAFSHIQIPLSDFKNQMQGIKAEEVIFFCQAGSRSRQAAALYNAYKNGNTKCYSLAGGILSWEAKHKMMNHG